MQHRNQHSIHAWLLGQSGWRSSTEDLHVWFKGFRISPKQYQVIIVRAKTWPVLGSTDQISSSQLTSSNLIPVNSRREECDRIATLLRTNLELDQSAGVGSLNKIGRTRTSATAESYHAGLTAHRRKTIQNQVGLDCVHFIKWPHVVKWIAKRLSFSCIRNRYSLPHKPKLTVVRFKLISITH